MTGDAFTFVAPEEEGDLRGIERAIGKRLPRVIIPDFDYQATPEAKLEVPRGERLAAMRAQKSGERARTKAKASRRSESSARPSRSEGPSRRPRSQAGSGSSQRPAPSAASRTLSTSPARATSGFGRRTRPPDKRGH
jgi:ATP-dependent RNA helicase RhlE